MKRRYTEIELVREIDKTHETIGSIQRLANGLSEDIDQMVKGGKVGGYMIEQMRVDEKRLRAKINSLQTNKLVHLKNALAAIRTKPLPGFEQELETVNL